MNTPKKDPNAHRARKRSFQANLEPEEDALVNQVKALRRVTTDRGLLSVQYEWAETAKAGLLKTTEPTGRVLLSQWYSASEKVREPEDEEEMLRTTPCPMCHL